MNKSEVGELFKAIKYIFPNFEAGLEKITFWHDLLSDVPFDTALLNLKRHAKTDKFPPTIAELIGRVDTSGQYVPGVEETRAYLAEKEAHDKKVKEEWDARRHADG